MFSYLSLQIFQKAPFFKGVFLFLAAPWGMWDPSFWPGIKPTPLHWKCEVLTIGRPGKSFRSSFKIQPSVDLSGGPHRVCPLLETTSCCSVAKSSLTLSDALDCSTPGPSVIHHLLEFAEIHVHWVGDATQPSYPLSPLSPFAFNFSQHLSWLLSSESALRIR